MRLMDIDLRKYLQQRRLTWKERIKIAYDIILALYRIHKGNAIHRDLHSGNILYLQSNNNWYISDLGFCGPADKPLKSIYGNLPYIAPEVIVGKESTFASDIYSIGMLMWEISSGKPPFFNYRYDYDFAMKMVGGMRPKIIPGTPLEYKKLIKQCCDANPLNRPDIKTLFHEIEKLWKDSYNDDNAIESSNTLEYEYDNNSPKQNSLLINYSTSKLYQFGNLPEPKNATEEEQEGNLFKNKYKININN
ncbi:kinase-like domain-containing protein [Glomus cerebriforme]|uniref:Kinase-like domain-containing protein n=1 Tax=Glomus cerebriforme TaxID=658196 RepID=A0A397T427_9GLOM|nr:kinase-like domain-containing protein [Glomus cerebriforme]